MMAEMCDRPEISVIVPTFRRPDLLARALQSVFMQSFSSYEVIVVNDDTDALLLTISDPRLRVINNNRTQGACGARNTGILAAKGRYITGLDDDDEFLPGRLAALIAGYKPDLSFIASGLFIQHKLWKRRRFRRERIIGYEDLLWGNCVGSQVLTERDKLLAVGGFDETLSAAQDLDLWLRITKRWGPGYRISAPLYLQHTSHSHGRISTGPRKIEGMKRQYDMYRDDMSISQRVVREVQIERYSGRGWPLSRLVSHPKAVQHFLKQAFDLF